MKAQKLICQYCESSIPSGAASMHSCGKVWYPFSPETKSICPHCREKEELIKCPSCKGPSKYETWLNQANVLEKEKLAREEELKTRKGFGWLEKIIDNCLDRMLLDDLMTSPASIPKEMLVKENSDSDWSTWKPMKSTIDDNALNEFENKHNIKLPYSYRHYLKYKHFFRLSTINKSVSQPNHLPIKTIDNLTGQDIYHLNLIKKGLLYFAHYHDHAILCFDTNSMTKKGECPIVAFEHELYYLPEHIEENDGNYIYNTFEEVLIAKEKWYRDE